MIAALWFTAQQYVVATEQYSLAMNSQQHDQYQKGFDSLRTDDAAPHLGAIYGLEFLSHERPEWRIPIMFGISSVAVAYSRSASGPTNKDKEFAQRARPDVAVALRVVSRNGVGADTVHLPLALGKFVGVSIDGGHLEYADLDRADLSGSDLFETNLYAANLYGAHLNAVSAPHANFSMTRLINARACAGPNYAVSERMIGENVRAGFASAEFYSATMTNMYLVDALATRAHFDNAVMDHVHFENANLYQSSFRNALLTDASFQHTDARETHFGAFPSHDAPRYASKLERTNFDGANLAKAEFSGLDLSTAIFTRTNLQDAKFPSQSSAIALTLRWKGARLCGTVFADRKADDNCSIPEPGQPDPVFVDCDKVDQANRASGLTVSVPTRKARRR